MTPVFTQFILSHASDNTTSQNIGGWMHGPSFPPQILGETVPPKSPSMRLPLGQSIRDGLFFLSFDQFISTQKLPSLSGNTGLCWEWRYSPIHLGCPHLTGILTS